MAIDYDAIQQAYIDNADYREADSVSKARAFVTACERLLILPEEIRKQSGEVRFADRLRIEAALKRAQDWLGGQVWSASRKNERYLTFEDYRD